MSPHPDTETYYNGNIIIKLKMCQFNLVCDLKYSMAALGLTNLCTSIRVNDSK